MTIGVNTMDSIETIYTIESATYVVERRFAGQKSLQQIVAEEIVTTMKNAAETQAVADPQ